MILIFLIKFLYLLYKLDQNTLWFQLHLEEYELDDQPLYEKPIGPNVPKGYRYSKKRGEYYDSMAGIRKWRESGGKAKPRDSKITPVKPEDTVKYEELLNIVN
ncbi:hypothetical protein C1646_672605 [Rhizophagus diaphanus]|nr:hypothetical protein C1646_672605 [Rhizophagus diaphanus] [Rhizophagus sp. MUCL 43196]